MKVKRNCFIYAVYRTRLNPVQDSVYRRWQILLVSSQIRLYVIWYLDLLSVPAYVYKTPWYFVEILLEGLQLKFMLSLWHNNSFLNTGYQEVFIWLQDLGRKIHSSAQLTFTFSSGFVLLSVSHSTSVFLYTLRTVSHHEVLSLEVNACISAGSWITSFQDVLWDFLPWFLEEVNFRLWLWLCITARSFFTSWLALHNQCWGFCIFFKG